MIQDMQCCGIREMDGLLDSSKETVQEFCSDIDSDSSYNGRPWPRFRYAIFSDIGPKHTRGNPLASYIRRHKLGKVVSTNWNVNPNSDNPLKVWVWTLDGKMLKKWWMEHGEDY